MAGHDLESSDFVLVAMMGPIIIGRDRMPLPTTAFESPPWSSPRATLASLPRFGILTDRL